MHDTHLTQIDVAIMTTHSSSVKSADHRGYAIQLNILLFVRARTLFWLFASQQASWSSFIDSFRHFDNSSFIIM